jgi:hypothetical protein
MCAQRLELWRQFFPVLGLEIPGAGPLNVDEELLAMIAAKAQSVSVGLLTIFGWAPSGWPLAQVCGLATYFPRVEMIYNSSVLPSAVFHQTLRGYASKGVAFPDVVRDGCFSAAANGTVRGYCFGESREVFEFFMDTDLRSSKVVLEKLVSVGLPRFSADYLTATLGTEKLRERTRAHIHAQARRSRGAGWTRELRVEARSFGY